MHIRKAPSMRYKPSTEGQPRPSPKTYNPSSQCTAFRQLAAEPASHDAPQSLHFSFQKDRRRLCFSNLKNSIKPAVVTCDQHPTKKAKYRDRASPKYYCFHCAIQIASQGRQLDEIENDSEKELSGLLDQCADKVLATNAQLEQEYKASRSVLLREMEVHRQYYEGIAERVAEMQARDMIMFQEVIQNAEREFQTLTEEIMSQYHELQAMDISNGISKQEIIGICGKILQKSEGAVTHKFPVVQPDSKIKTKLQNMQTILSGLRLQFRNPIATSVLSQILKSNSTFESQKPRQRDQKIQKSVQDTPQSVKHKLSVCKSIVDPKQIKHISNIDFCESMMGNSKSELKYRYKCTTDDH